MCRAEWEKSIYAKNSGLERITALENTRITMADTAKDKDVIDQEDVEVEEQEETTTTTTTTKKTSQWHKTRTTKVRNGSVEKWECRWEIRPRRLSNWQMPDGLKVPLVVDISERASLCL